MANKFMPPQPQGQENKVKTVPSPTGGLNAKDSLANMPETDAISMQNWWPQPYGCSVRPGWQEWATQLTGKVGTLASWAGANGTTKLFAWAGDDISFYSIYDVTTRMLPSDPAPTPLVTGLSNAHWQVTQMSNAAGNTLVAVNGADPGIVYGPSGATRIAYVAVPVVPPTPPAADTWYGLDSATVTHVTTHQGRLWATQGGSGRGWYLKEVGTLFGEWQAFDFGSLFTKGGYIEFMTTWTIDDGNGAEDHLVVVSSQGQAAVYGGTDPEDDTKWMLVGLYFVGAPVPGLRAHQKIGGDMLLVTQRGLVSMTELLASTKVNAGVSDVKGEKVQLLVSSLASTVTIAEGWQAYYDPGENVFLINVPSSIADGNRQLAANTVTQACPWTFFVGMNALCWVTSNNDIFFGDYSGRVCRAWVGHEDAVPLDNSPGIGIQTQVQQAYSYLGAPALQKQIGLYRPNFLATGPANYRSRVEYDFQVQPIRAPSGIPPTDDTVWGTGIWDTSVWGGGLSPDRRWIMAQGIGNAASLRMTLVAYAEVNWVSTDYSYQSGTVL